MQVLSLYEWSTRVVQHVGWLRHSHVVIAVGQMLLDLVRDQADGIDWLDTKCVWIAGPEPTRLRFSVFIDKASGGKSKLTREQLTCQALETTADVARILNLSTEHAQKVQSWIESFGKTQLSLIASEPMHVTGKQPLQQESKADTMTANSVSAPVNEKMENAHKTLKRRRRTQWDALLDENAKNPRLSNLPTWKRRVRARVA